VPGQVALEGLAQVLGDVPAIGHLHRLRRSARRALGVGLAAIAANDLDPWMLLQPGRDRRGAAIGQEINHLMLRQIDEDRPIGMPFVLRPVVDAECPGHRDKWLRHGPDET